jgi:hypothetical protein
MPESELKSLQLSSPDARLLYSASSGCDRLIPKPSCIEVSTYAGAAKRLVHSSAIGWFPNLLALFSKVSSCPLCWNLQPKSFPPVPLGDPKRLCTFQIMAHGGGRLTESIPAAYATFSATVVLWLEVWQFSNPAIAGYKCDHQFHLCQCKPQLSIGQFQNMPAAFMLGAICLHGMVPTHSTLNGASDSKDQASPNDFHSFAVSISTTYSKICLL